MEDATLVKRAHNLFILRSKAGGKAYPLQGEMLVGREEDCSIPIDSGHISRYHAKINMSSNGVYIEDLHSTNGTFVNGSKIKGRVKLAIGDEVSFDDVCFNLASDTAEGEAETLLSAKQLEQGERFARAMAQPRPIRTATPIRSSIAAAGPEQSNTSAAKRDPHAAIHSFFPKADDIDLDKPLSPRHTLADEPDFEKHLEQGFHELDALLDETPAEQAHISTSVTPVPIGAGLKRQTTVAPAHIPEALSTVSDSEGLATKRATDAANPADAVPAAKSAGGEEDRTQILSSAQLDQFIERHRYDDDLNVGSGPRLIVTTAPLRGKLFSLEEFATGSSVQLGRAPNAEIYLNDKTISTDHARISKTDEGYVLRVTHAKNGMLVNGVTQSSVTLTHNDKIQIGRSELVFKTDSTQQEPLKRQRKDPLVNNGQGQRYSMLITLIVLIVLVGAIVATSR